MKLTDAISLKQHIKRQTIKWSTLGLLSSIILGFLAAVYFGKATSEDHVLTVARAATEAFRPTILSTNDIKNVEEQMRSAFRLQFGESMVIRGLDFKRVYAFAQVDGNNQDEPSCSSGKVCWDRGYRHVSVLVPIYFGEKTKDFYGYLDVSLRPTYNAQLLLTLLTLMVLGFFVQSAGLSIKLIGVASVIGDRLSSWSNHIKNNPKKDLLKSEQSPFEELKPMEDALSSLRHEIEALETQAKRAGQSTVLRCISHDIISPVSQLSKYIAIVLHLVDAKKPVDPDIIESINRVLGRIKNFAYQAKALQAQSNATLTSSDELNESDSCDLTREIRQILADLEIDEEIKSQEISFELIESQTAPSTAMIDRQDCHRIVDNLVRNAVHASTPGKKVTLTLDTVDGGPALSIIDEGTGIEDSIKEQIFDLDFTTKPGRGTGLGLPIVKHLCEKNGAKINLSTGVGIGTKFQIVFRPAFLAGAKI